MERMIGQEDLRELGGGKETRQTRNEMQYMNENGIAWEERLLQSWDKGS